MKPQRLLITAVAIAFTAAGCQQPVSAPASQGNPVRPSLSETGTEADDRNDVVATDTTDAGAVGIGWMGGGH